MSNLHKWFRGPFTEPESEDEAYERRRQEMDDNGLDTGFRGRELWREGLSSKFKERALAKQQEAHEAERTAAVAEALERVAERAERYVGPCKETVKELVEYARSLKPHSEMVCKHEHTDVSQPNMDDADYRVECKDCGKVWWHDGPDS